MENLIESTYNYSDEKIIGYSFHINLLITINR